MSNQADFRARSALMSLVLATFSAGVFAASPCGDRPEAPSIIDGATATMDDLVANSEAVKAYIAEADEYLNCYETFAKSDDYKAMSAEDQRTEVKSYKEVLKVRNAIGEDFNDEVKAYKKANPS